MVIDGDDGFLDEDVTEEQIETSKNITTTKTTLIQVTTTATTRTTKTNVTTIRTAAMKMISRKSYKLAFVPSGMT